MSDDAKEPDTDEEGPLGGERLRAARRANDISLRDIAKELHLDEGKVRALEQNDFDVLGAPVFAKGHLRKYAELVGAAKLYGTVLDALGYRGTAHRGPG